jgi:hypothetical protein
MKILLSSFLLIFLLSCEKIEIRKWKCTTEILITTSKCAPDTTRIVAYYDGMTNNQILDIQKINTYYSFQIEKGDTIALIESSCNCDPFVCAK